MIVPQVVSVENLRSKNKVAVLGGGESGVGAALLAKQKGKPVFLSELGEIRPDRKAELRKAAVEFEEGKHSLDRILSADVVVKSPGIPTNAPLIKKVKRQGIPIVAEIEFAFWHCPGKIIAITGSNGKTTSTLLLYHLLKEAGVKVEIAGNVGFSFARKICDAQADWYVLEVSSFQLDDILLFRPDIAVLLNITPDHLDRYGGKMVAYAAAKFRITEQQGPRDWFLYNQEDLQIQKLLKSGAVKAQQLGVKMSAPGFNWPFVNLLQTTNPALQGKHNRFNLACALHACILMGLEKNDLAEAIDSFVNAPHRMERVGDLDGATYINDSKATNVEAVYYALDGLSKPLIWIAGGQDKGNDYTLIRSLVRDKVKALVCLGADNEKLLATFPDLPARETRTVKEAVEEAMGFANPGDIVILSPACASFDLFKNYEDRGDQFRQVVLEKIEKTTNN